MVCHISKSRDRVSHGTSPAAIVFELLKKYEIIDPHAGNLGEREMIENYILSGEAGGLTIYGARQA